MAAKTAEGRAAAKERERETRALLGPRLGFAPKGGHPVTLEPRHPRRTGCAPEAIRDTDGKAVGSS